LKNQKELLSTTKKNVTLVQNITNITNVTNHNVVKEKPRDVTSSIVLKEKSLASTSAAGF